MLFSRGVVRKQRNRELWCNFCPVPSARVCPPCVHKMELLTLTHSRQLPCTASVRSLSPFAGNDVSIKSRRVGSSGAPNNGPALQRRPWGSAEGQRLPHALPSVVM